MRKKTRRSGLHGIGVVVVMILWIFGTAGYASGPSTQNGPRGAEPLPRVIDWTPTTPLPDDLVFVNHLGPGNKGVTFLVTLGEDGKVSEVQPIGGFSLYLSRLTPQIKQATFDPKQTGRAFVLRLKEDPQQKSLEAWETYSQQTCTPRTALSVMYRVAELRLGSDDNAASHCYKYILDKNPSSLAARYGVARQCLDREDLCAESYLESLVESDPDFVEARVGLASLHSWSEGEMAHVAAYEEMLKLQLPLATRESLLNSEIFTLERAHHLDQAVDATERWNAALTRLLAVYPRQVLFRYTEAIDHALLEEAAGKFQNAAVTYQLATSIVRQNQAASEFSAYLIDLGLARSLTHLARPAEAKLLCDRWKGRWKQIAGHSSRNASADGVMELEARWEFSCGAPQRGEELINSAITKYPESDAPYNALSEFYYSIGQIDQARSAKAKAEQLREASAEKLREAEDRRIGLAN
ncbi:tetratricopeptide repeat protein [Terriglobus albidus]|uniref:tetratricopeptide repeat protein n=1 Tax=Terriglobus albidus TaxID=1592106 RepID=UPI0021E0665E|nr:hypothetical protein [Terriglobus albidus]